jgi:exosortase A-associated hydrolase 1
MTVESPLTLDCHGLELAAILHAGAPGATLGLLIVVGGPQYRVGSHRQFVHLARYLSKHGVTVMRFDVAGMGDSEGDKQTFDNLDADIRCAIDAFMGECSLMKGVVLWGLCDGASAALMYAPTDDRVAGLVLVNPWLENAEARARTHLWDYYRQRLFAADFWRRLIGGELALMTSVSEFGTTLRRAFGHNQASFVTAKIACSPYQIRMIEAFERLEIPLCWMLSGRDLTAGEFERHYHSDSRWQRAASKGYIRVERFPRADHTFSSGHWKDAVAEATLKFLEETKSQSMN